MRLFGNGVRALLIRAALEAFVGKSDRYSVSKEQFASLTNAEQRKLKILAPEMFGPVASGGWHQIGRGERTIVSLHNRINDGRRKNWRRHKKHAPVARARVCPTMWAREQIRWAKVEAAAA